MAYRVDGKIACQFSWGAVNYDVKKVIVLDAMHPTSGASDERYAANKIYYIPAGVTPASFNDLQQYRIWHRYWESQKTLLAQNQDVCIEFVPLQDIQLTASTPIAIFTDSSTSDEDANFAIFHESGLVVAKTTGDTIDPNVSELYGLSGEKRSLSVTGVTLKAGFKYYIQYTNKNGYKNSTFQPAYFQGETGNYLAWVHDSVQQKSVANINSVEHYLGVVSDASTWLSADEDDLIISQIGQGGLSNSDAYIRNGSYNSASVIGVSGQSLPIAEKDKLLSLNANDVFMYIGTDYVEQSTKILEQYQIYTKNSTLDSSKYKGIKTTAKGILDGLNTGDYCLYNGSNVQYIIEAGHIYQKTGNIQIDDDIDLTALSGDIVKIMAIADKSASITPYRNIAIKQGSINNNDYTGYVFTLKSGYYRDFGQNNAGYTCATVPTVDKTIYYITDTGEVPGGGWVWAAGLWFYDSTAGEKWKFVAQDGNVSSLSSYFDMVTFASAIQEIYISGSVTSTATLSDLVKTHFNSSYISNDLKSQTLQTDKKFYLSINGQEV